MSATRLSASAVPAQKVSINTLRNRTAMGEIIFPMFEIPIAGGSAKLRSAEKINATLLANIAGPLDRNRRGKVVGVAAQVEVEVFGLGGDILGQAELGVHPTDILLSEMVGLPGMELKIVCATTSPAARSPCPKTSRRS
jgi:hypothetical protein